MKAKKERAPAEESIFLRILWSAQTLTCFCLIALVDPQVCYLNFFGLKVPFLLFDFWVALSGMLLSYYYRHQNVKFLEWLGVSTIFLCCTWFVNYMGMQFATTEDIDVLLPTVHLMGGLFVCHSFELRSRGDFNFSLVFSIFLVCFAACLGKGAVFGLAMFVYVVLAATLLLLDCESRTFGSVQARAIDGAQSFHMQRAGSSEKTANLLFPTFALLGLSVSFFLVAPRAESLADQVSAKIYSIIKKDVKSIPSQHFPSNRVRTPFRPLHEPALNQTSRDDERSKPNSEKERNAKEREKNAKGKDSSLQKTKSSAKEKLGHAPYSRKEEKKKREAEEKKSQEKDASQEESFAGKGLSQDSPAGGSPDTGSARTGNHVTGEKSSKNNNAERDKTGSEKPGNQNTKSNAGRRPSLGNAPEHKDDPGQKSGDSQKQDNNNGASESSGKGGSPSEKEHGKQNQSQSAQVGAEKFEKHSSPSSLNKEQAPDKPLNPGDFKKSGKDDGKTPDAAKPKETESRKEEVHIIPDSLSLKGGAETQDTPIFSVVCNRTVYFKQGSYDQFDGQNWTVSAGIAHGALPRAENGNYSAKDASPIKLSQNVPAIRLKQKYHMLANLDSKLMTAGNPYEIQYAGPSIEIDECGNLKGAWTLVKGLEYEVWSDEPLYDMKAMRAEGIPGDTEEERLHAAYSRFMRIPRNHSDEFYELARKLTGPQDNWLVQSESICNYLRKNYKYSLEKTSKNSGNYKNAVDRFLFESKQGDCKDFSSAFVMLCRASGIPARLVIGFAPGDFDAASGTRIIKLKNTHAWGEIYFPSYGWVPFDATPTGMLPARQQEEERYFTSVGEKLDSALKMQSVSADKGGSTGGGISIKIGAGKNMTIVIGPWEIVKGLVAVLAVMALSGPLMLVGKHLFLKIRLPRRMHPASKVYCGLLNDLRALGITRNDSQTGSELLQQIEANLQAENVETAAHIKAAVEAFIADYNALYFGGYGTLKQLEQKRSEIKTMLRGSKLIAVQKD